MTENDVGTVVTRCPYCQGVELTRLVESDYLPVDVFRCRGCGTQFNIDRVRDDSEPPEELTIS
jgi:DNA-directed RNA polymerase subunit RPC12/RpoP